MGCPLPRKFCYSLVTSWVFPFFDGEMTFAPCASSTAAAPPAACSLRYHMPFSDVDLCWNVCVVFRPCKGRLAVLTVSPYLKCADFTGVDSPLG
jgi:hypothetical protein